MSRVLAVCLLTLAMLLSARPVRAEVRTYVIAIGNNSPPVQGGGERLPTLHYADDDAAAFHAFASPLARRSLLLTVLDAASQARFPTAAAGARPPTLVELRRVVAEYRALFVEDRAAGHDPVLLFFYSGHGARDAGRPASLTLADGPLTQTILYDEVLASLPARAIHLLVDACYAESVVRPRDAQAESVDLSAADIAAANAKTTLARFPNVGAVIAASTSARTFEWDALERGVFTHELLSGLRGAADVNRDGRVEYSEIAAFLGAANREVSDPRARLTVVTKPPPVDQHAALVDLRALRGHGTVSGKSAGLPRFFIEDALGNRVADVHVESGFSLALRLPVGHYYLRAGEAESELDIREGELVALEKVAVATAPRSRGAIEDALGRGVFATAFGPLYYRAFLDGSTGLLPVTFAPPADGPAGKQRGTPHGPAVAIALGAAGVFAATTIASTALMLGAKSDFNGASVERDATDARERYGTLRVVSVVGLAATVVSAGLGVYLLWSRPATSTRAGAPMADGVRLAW